VLTHVEETVYPGTAFHHWGNVVDPDTCAHIKIPFNILWHIDALLGNDLEANHEKTALC
jgi:hypothetical protein